MESVEIGIGQLVVQDNSTGVAASSDNVNTGIEELFSLWSFY